MFKVNGMTMDIKCLDFKQANYKILETGQVNIFFYKKLKTTI